MKTFISLAFLLTIAINLNAQTKKEKIEARKKAANWRVQDAKNKASQLNAKQSEELTSMASAIKNMMYHLESNYESLEEIKAFYDSKNPKLFEQFTTTYNKYASEGKTSAVLNNLSHIANDELSEFLNTKVYTYLNDRLNLVKAASKSSKRANSNDTSKEMALKEWQKLAVFSDFFIKVLPNNAQINDIHEQVNSEVNTYEGLIASQYASNLGTELHKKFREKVILSHSPIAYGKEN